MLTYVLDNWAKFILAGMLMMAYAIGSSLLLSTNEVAVAQEAAQQLDLSRASTNQTQQHIIRNNATAIGWCVMAVVVFLIFLGDLKEGLKKMKAALTAAALLVMVCCSGCYRPFEPVKLEVISSTEEGFLLPFLGDAKNQSSSDNEDFLTKSLVFTQQVKIPQQWVQKGFEYAGPNGEWRDAAILIKVDKQSVTREWTADPNSGTSNRNEAIWVMTSDQVEFSTGWSITAMIASREDAVTFLHRYRNGSLKDVLDHEVRAKIQTTFGLEVTDLPMDELRKQATPHITHVVETVTKFFKERGITITNLGITGGFVYKDKSVQDKLVEVFNSEQEVNIAMAKDKAQEVKNKMMLSMKTAEADGMKAIADAKLYEIEKTHENINEYVQLKMLELAKEAVAKWDGEFPVYYFTTGGGAENKVPQMLMNLPTPTKK